VSADRFYEAVEDLKQAVCICKSFRHVTYIIEYVVNDKFIIYYFWQ